MSKNNLIVDTMQFISAVSFALDLAQKSIFEDNYKQVRFDVPIVDFNPKQHNFMGHSNKTTLVSLYIAQKLGVSRDVFPRLYISALLHDIGSVHAFSRCHNDSDFILQHCEHGAEVIKDFKIDSALSDIVMLHHENHDGSGPLGSAGDSIPVESRIIHLADYFELMFSGNKSYRLQKDGILSQIKAKRSTIFNPECVDALFDVSKSESFWLDIENIDSCQGIVEELLPPDMLSIYSLSARDMAQAFSRIIDMKSQFTLEHSNGLANHVRKLSGYYNLPDEKTERLEIAAMLHDLGKLSVPNHILDKPGKLTQEEFNIVREHTYYTRQILRKIKGFEDISEWAANHHETLQGSGYPRKLTCKELGLESRMMTVCDIFQALTEDRPYRKGMSKSVAVGILDSLVENKSIDGRIVKDLKEII